MEALTELGVRALEAAVRHHRALACGLACRATSIEQAVLRHDHLRPYVEDMVDFMTGQVLAYASIEEDTLYAPVDARAQLGDLPAQMTGEHDGLGSALSRVTATGTAAEVVAESGRLAEIFASHVAEEEKLVLPKLFASNGVDAEGFVARTGRLARATWTTADLDVRGLDPGYRQRLVFERFDGLSPGRSFVLVDDKDPDPVRHRLRARYGEDIAWEVALGGPVLWRAEVGRRRQLREPAA